MQINKKCFSHKGSLLLEVMIVIVILSVGLTFIVQSLSSSLRALNYSRNYSQAAFLIDNKLSELMLKKTVENNVRESDYFAEPFKEYHYEITSSSKTWPEEASNTVNQINFRLSWPSGKNTQSIDTVLCLLNPSEEFSQSP